MNHYGSDHKKINFAIEVKKHVDLRIRLRHDDLSQVRFFKAMVDGYLENNELILQYINGYKEENNIQSIKKREKSMKLIEKGKEELDKFVFSDKELEDIFDIIKTGEDI
tara:strand:+ start:78 stop:404 length:327 start_codon:yes stop_codon:yes gene_type:complete